MADLQNEQKQAQKTIKAGTGMRRITPPIGAAMGGFAFRNHGSEGIYDDLFARCLWLEDANKQRLVILALDICSVDFSLINEWKAEMKQRWGLADHEILINMSHTHSGPLTVYRFYQPKSLEESYMVTLHDRIMEAVDEASYLEDDCTLHAGQNEINLGICRRYPDGDTARWAPYPGGYVERNLTVLTVKDRLEQPLCVVYNLSAHPSILTDYLISADYPGAASRQINNTLGGRVMAMFVQGCAGDVKVNVNADVKNGKWLKATYDDVKRSGSMVAEAVLQIIAEKSYAVDPALSTALVQADLPIGLPADPAEIPSFYTNFPRIERLPVDQWANYWLSRFREQGYLSPTLAVPVQVIRIGSLNFIAMGGELTSGLADVMRQALPAEVKPVFLGYSNGVFGYLPSEKMVVEGGYESLFSVMYSKNLAAPFAPGLEKALVAAMEQGLAHTV